MEFLGDLLPANDPCEVGLGECDFFSEVGLVECGFFYEAGLEKYDFLYEVGFGSDDNTLKSTIDEIDVSEDGNIKEGEEFDFEEIDFGSLNEDEVKKYRFVNNDIAYNFYKMYGLKKEFGIRKYHIRRDKDGEILWQSFFCDREGFRDKKNELVRKMIQEKKRDVVV
ncbi:hypothetical protein Lal_00019798 [Lupinus albus]|nr:hypothetical protein Lal_00019798 [Lupinus albus]